VEVLSSTLDLEKLGFFEILVYCKPLLEDAYLGYSVRSPPFPYSLLTA
jgi:hypothetical protein